MNIYNNITIKTLIFSVYPSTSIIMAIVFFPFFYSFVYLLLFVCCSFG
eukprot:UN01375